MLNFLGNVISTLLESLINNKHKPHISVLVYFVSGIIGSICIVSNYAPFCCNSDFIDGIVLKENLSDLQFVVQFAILMITVQMIYIAIQNILLTNIMVTRVNCKLFALLFTFGDLIDLLCSIASLLFILTVFIQMYHTGSVYLSSKAIVIYLWIAYKFFTFICARYTNKNIEIINNALKKFP